MPPVLMSKHKADGAFRRFNISTFKFSDFTARQLVLYL